MLRVLGTDAGPGNEEAARRLEERGPNELEDRGGTNPWAILWEQFTSTMIVILVVAAVASALLGDYEAHRSAKTWRRSKVEVRPNRCCSSSLLGKVMARHTDSLGE